jgi:hypothetical protein
MSNIYLRFDTEAKAINANIKISNGMGCPVIPCNNLTGKLSPDKQQTICWSTPHNTIDNNTYWVIPKPDDLYISEIVDDYTEEEKDEAWFQSGDVG